MTKLRKQFVKKQTQLAHNRITYNDVFRNEDGAIDLSSIMVGILVIGLIGGVIAATVFSVIPWAQDNAAKQQLDAVRTAENAYYGLSADPAITDPAKMNQYAGSYGLDTAGLLDQSPAVYCVTMSADGKNYTAYSKSASGKIWSVNNNSDQITQFIGTDPSNCLGDVKNGSVITPKTTPDDGVPPPKVGVLVKKWDFTSGVDGWTNGTANTTVALAYGDSAHGNVGRVTGQINSNQINSINYYTGLTIGKTYRVTVDLYAGSNVKSFNVSVNNGSSLDSSAITAGTWRTYSFEFTATSAQPNFQTIAYTTVTNAATVYYMDNFKVEDIT